MVGGRGSYITRKSKKIDRRGVKKNYVNKENLYIKGEGGVKERKNHFILNSFSAHFICINAVQMHVFEA